MLLYAVVLKGGICMLANKDLEKIMQNAEECVLNSQAAISGYISNNNLMVSIQFMNQAFLCAKQVQSLYYNICQHPTAFEVEEFYHQFLFLNQEFLTSIETDHGQQHSLIELRRLEDMLQSLKSNSMLV